MPLSKSSRRNWPREAGTTTRDERFLLFLHYRSTSRFRWRHSRWPKEDPLQTGAENILLEPSVRDLRILTGVGIFQNGYFSLDDGQQFLSQGPVIGVVREAPADKGPELRIDVPPIPIEQGISVRDHTLPNIC